MYQSIHKNILHWYERYGRHHLPWRNRGDAYAIWISEIMLQQTQVKTVLERFYHPFLERFPTLESLAQANEDEVLKMWEGLGYYSRARNLHKASQLCNGVFPSTIEGLLALPGIGKSTAHAIAAFAYAKSVPILDANVKRILCRVFGIKEPKEKLLWEYAYRLLDTKHPFEYNQAMMDIGASICSRVKPTCKSCPFESICIASSDNPECYPQKKVKKKVPINYLNMLVYHHNGKYGLYKREQRFLGGLYAFKTIERESFVDGVRLGHIKHQYSHFHIDVEVYLVDEEIDELEYYSVDEIASLAISTADKKALKLLLTT